MTLYVIKHKRQHFGEKSLNFRPTTSQHHISAKIEPIFFWFSMFTSVIFSDQGFISFYHKSLDIAVQKIDNKNKSTLDFCKQS